MLAMIPVGSPNADHNALGCDSDSLNRARHLAIDPSDQVARLTGQSVLYSCRVRKMYADNPAAMFLAELSLRSSSLLRQSDLTSQQILDFLGWIETSTRSLAANPVVAGKDQLLQVANDVAAVRRDSQSVLNSALGQAGAMRAVAEHQSELESHFCSWKAQIEAATQGSTQGWPREIVACRGY
jgi:hypothetical protein